MPFCRILAAATLTFALAGAAHAFTIEGGPDSSGPSSKWQDLDTAKRAADPDSRFKTDEDGTKFKSGNSTFYFGPQRSLDQRYDTNNLFDPYARDGR